MRRFVRRLLVPFAVLVTATALGTFVIGRDHVAASSPLMQNPGAKLTGDTNMTQSDLIARGKVLFDETCSRNASAEAISDRRIWEINAAVMISQSSNC